MMSNFIWMVILTVSVCVIILSAAIGDPPTLMAMTGIISFALALIAIREHRNLELSGASRASLSASTARHMGLIWMWGALGLLVSYGLILSETWPDWTYYFAAFAAASIACLLYAGTVDRDEALGREDQTMVNLGKYLLIAQLLGVLVALITIYLDPSMQLLSDANPDWVANNIFIAGAIALTAVSGYALMQDSKHQTIQAQNA